MSHPGSPFWVPSPALQRHLNRTATGNPEVDWLLHVRLKHLPRSLGRTLVLGCGNGFLERALARHEGIGTILATDPDPRNVAEAAHQARRYGVATVSHAALDPARAELPEGPWDLVLAQDLLHHLPDLPGLFARIHAALARDGRFVFSEYVGPARFQYSEERLETVRRYFRVLPDHLRIDPETGLALWRRERIDAERLAREDPLEAAASDSLLPLARRAFSPETELSGGEGLLHPLFCGLAFQFREDDERLLEVLCAAEEHLTSRGVLSPAFGAFVGRRRDG